MSWLRGLIETGVRNPVYANLLMVCMLVGGGLSARRMVRESYPEFSLDHIAIEVSYPGASTTDIERAICTPIEEAVRGISGVFEISSSAQENFGIVWVALSSHVSDPQIALDEVKNRVDQITSLPRDAGKPVVHESIIRTGVINIAIFGDVPERTLKGYAQEVRDDLLANPGISQILLSGVRENEIIIEVSKQALAAYHLSLPEVMSVIATSSLDLPAGVIRTAEEEYTLRTAGQRYAAREYEDLVIVDRGNGAVRLKDLGTVREGFEEAVVRGRFKGQPSVVVQVFKTPDEDATSMAAFVRDYVAQRQPHLPDQLTMSVWADGSRDIDTRIEMLVENGLWGIGLVFLTLTLFLELRLAFWVAIGIPIAFAGALIMMYMNGQTLNMISLFALIMVTGIIVDDAIVIAESVHARRRLGAMPQQAAIEGTARMAMPVLGASITTIVAFVPLLYVVGIMGRFIHVLPIVVIAAVIASSVEAFGILPTHLCRTHRYGARVSNGTWSRRRSRMDTFIAYAVTRWYRPLYRKAIRSRGATVSLTLALLLVSAGLVVGGRTPLVLLGAEDGNILRARVRFPEGTPLSLTEETVNRLTEAAWALNEDPALTPHAKGDLVRQVYSITGEFQDFLAFRGNNLCEVRVELMPAEERRLPDETIIEHWRRGVGEIAHATRVTLSRKPLGPLESPIEIRLLGQDLDDMIEASTRIQTKLSEYDGLFNVEDDLIAGKRELIVGLQPGAEALGLTLDSVAKQLRYGFFGGEAVKLQRGRDQVTVRIRYPEEERRSVTDLERVRIQTPSGHEVPFREIATVRWSRGYSYIMHQDGHRRIRVIADVDDRVANSQRILDELDAGFLADVVDDYNDLTYVIAGNREYMAESVDSLFSGFAMAMVAIYTILAGMLRSYVQPVVILLAVPFGLVGVIAGHAVLGYDMTLMSLFGAVALSGVVVNDSLVLLDAVNRGIREGQGVRRAVLRAGELRFRAVTLTSITTVAGLMPILLERSSQAQSVKPMAVSLGCGLLFATLLTLFVLPATYLLLNDTRRYIHWLRFGGPYPVAELVEEAARERTADIVMNAP